MTDHLRTAWNKDDLLAAVTRHGVGVQGTGVGGRVLKVDLVRALEAAGIHVHTETQEAPMAQSYEVLHAFAVGKEWVTPHNTEPIKTLSRSDKDALIEAGHIIEHGDKIAVDDQPGTKGA